MAELGSIMMTAKTVLSFSKALAVELRGTGVTVTALCPGLTRTGFMEHAGATSSVLEKTPGSSPERVAMAGYKGLMRGRSVVIPGMLTKFLAFAGELPPRRIALAVNERLLRRARSGPPGPRPERGASPD